MAAVRSSVSNAEGYEELTQGTVRKRVTRPDITDPTASGSGPIAIPARPSRPINVRTATKPVLPALPPIALRRAPYAHQPQETTAQIDWRLRMARVWIQWHIVVALIALVAAITATLTAQNLHVAEIWLCCFALGSVAICAVAFRALDYQAPGGAVILMSISDGFALVVTLLLLGINAESLALLPGTLLIIAILANARIAILAGIANFLIYLGFYLYGDSTGAILDTRIWLDGHSILLAHALLLAIGGVLLLVAIGLVTRQLRQAMAQVAALDYAVRVAERRARAKREVIDHDAIALQSMLVRTLRGAHPQPVKTSEDLAPLANMIHAVNQRLPGLLRDREMRLRLESAIRDLGDALEKSGAGFAWSWPALSGTPLDRVITLLQPATQQRPTA